MSVYETDVAGSNPAEGTILLPYLYMETFRHIRNQHYLDACYSHADWVHWFSKVDHGENSLRAYLATGALAWVTHTEFDHCEGQWEPILP